MTALAPTLPEIRGPVPTANSGSNHAQVIGYSKERRSIFCLPRGDMDAPLKVLVLAGQHGDERPALRSVETLLGARADEIAERLPHTQLGLIPEVNPDGCAMRTRFNADGIDLNRDHQLLRSDETVAIHKFVRQWQPQVIVDVHSYPSRRRHLLEHNVVLNHDVFVDVPSHPAILARPGGAQAREVLRGILRALAARDVHAARYTIVETSGRARHSTPDVVDARNGLALRYGVFTLLVENRQPRRDETPEERQQLRHAQECALWTVLEWLDRNHALFPPLFNFQSPTPGLPVPVRFKYQPHWHGLNLTCRDAELGSDVNVVISRYCASLVARRTVLLPSAYAVPADLEELRAVLHRHGFASTPNRPGAVCHVEKLRIAKARPSRRPSKSVRKLVLTTYPMDMAMDHYEIFPTHQNGGEALAVFLEPESQHGLHRYGAAQIPIVAPSWYPVLRVYNGHSWFHPTNASLGPLDGSPSQ